LATVSGSFMDVTLSSLCCVGTWPPISEVSLHRKLIVILNVTKDQILSDNCYSVLLFYNLLLLFLCVFSVTVSCATWFGWRLGPHGKVSGAVYL